MKMLGQHSSGELQMLYKRQSTNATICVGTTFMHHKPHSREWLPKPPRVEIASTINDGKQGQLVNNPSWAGCVWPVG